MYDHYNFDPQYPATNLAQYGVDVAERGETLGIAKPFLVYSSDTSWRWPGVR
jgi:hypothetical protein